MSALKFMLRSVELRIADSRLAEQKAKTRKAVAEAELAELTRRRAQIELGRDFGPDAVPRKKDGA